MAWRVVCSGSLVVSFTVEVFFEMLVGGSLIYISVAVGVLFVLVDSGIGTSCAFGGCACLSPLRNV